MCLSYVGCALTVGSQQYRSAGVANDSLQSLQSLLGAVLWGVCSGVRSTARARSVHCGLIADIWWVAALASLILGGAHRQRPTWAHMVADARALA